MLASLTSTSLFSFSCSLHYKSIKVFLMLNASLAVPFSLFGHFTYFNTLKQYYFISLTPVLPFHVYLSLLFYKIKLEIVFIKFRTAWNTHIHENTHTFRFNQKPLNFIFSHLTSFKKH